MANQIDDLPLNIRNSVRRILQLEVTGGGARYQSTGCRRGIQGQKAISKILQDAGISKTDPRWAAVINFGRDLYYGRTSWRTSAAPTRQNAGKSATFPTPEEGTVYTQGSSFRARAEAHQRRFRAEVIRAGWVKYGHWLDDRATEAGANFHHPAALAAAKNRANSGKGVGRARTFGNMLSSQAMCFNIFGPLAASPDGLDLAGQLLAQFVDSLARVRKIEIEYTPAFEVFQDQSEYSGVDCDVLIEFDNIQGQRGILVIETKFVENSFSQCGHRQKDACPADIRIGDNFSGCRYVSKNRFLYWQRTAETSSVRLPLADLHGCPFGGPLWQIWVNHTLAHAEAHRRGATKAIFAVCAPSENDELLEHGTLLEQFRQLATDPSTIVFIPLSNLLERLLDICEKRPAWQEWASMIRRRYTVPSTTTKSISARHVPAVTERHRKMVQWMATQEFRDIVTVHQNACGNRATIYFRPTNTGIVRIGLHPSAPGYVGFRKHADDSSYLLHPGGHVYSVSEVKKHLLAFEEWLPTVSRQSIEEQGVITWLRRAMENLLQLSDMEDGWVFLHQEWRFIGDARRSDILAVHIPTGQLGIIEFKSAESDLDEARMQVDRYGRFWARDAEELAPFFTDLLKAMCAAYGNQSAAETVVSTKPAALFIGVASPQQKIRIQER